MAFNLDSYAYEGILNNPNITKDVIDELLRRKKDLIFEAVAQSQMATSAQLQLVYKRNKSFESLYGLINNPNTPTSILEEMFDLPPKLYFPHWKRSVCKHPSIPRNILSRYLEKETIEDNEELEYNWLAENPALSTKEDQFILAKKLSDPKYLFENSSLHLEVFEFLWNSGITEDADSFIDSSYCNEKHAVRICNSNGEAVGSRNAPTKVIIQARYNSSDVIRRAAFKNTKVPLNYKELDYENLASLQGITQRNDVSEELLLKISQLEISRDSSISWHLFLNKNTPVSVLSELFNLDKKRPPLNPNLPSSILKSVIEGDDGVYKTIALKHPKITLTQLKDYLEL